MKKMMLTFVLLASVYGKTPSLHTFTFSAGWVVPLVEKGSKTFVVLGREAGGKNKGTYDAFGGSRVYALDKEPVDTASREFYEEAIADRTLGMSLADMHSYLDLGRGYTQAILAIDDKKYGHGSIMYLTNFSDETIAKLETNFLPARAAAQKWSEKEKDALASVSLIDLKKAIRASSRNSGVQVQATVTDKQGTVRQESIELRGIFVRLFRCYADDRPYTPGTDARIRFYTI